MAALRLGRPLAAAPLPQLVTQDWLSGASRALKGLCSGHPCIGWLSLEASVFISQAKMSVCLKETL